jgi:hypothetical protein
MHGWVSTSRWIAAVAQVHSRRAHDGPRPQSYWPIGISIKGWVAERLNARSVACMYFHNGRELQRMENNLNKYVTDGILE